VTLRQAIGSPDNVVLALTRISKRFGNSVALEDVSFRVARSTVHALVGENGAGKTTLMRIAFGLTRPDVGLVMADDSTRSITSPAEAIDAGIGMVHQHFSHVPAMTVAENVALGGRGRFDATRAAREVANLGQRTGLFLDPQAKAESLPVSAQQRLEILKSLARRARILILDEPTAVLAPAEAEELLRWLRAFADEGNSVVLITHKLSEALAIADEITVLRRGRVVLSANAGELTPRGLASALIGEELTPSSRHEPAAVGSEVIAAIREAELRDERGVTILRHADLEIHTGEIVGLAAVEGAGQRELLRLLAKRGGAHSGTVQLADNTGFVPEDRHRDALVLEFTLAENVALKDAGARSGIMRWGDISHQTERLIRDFDVRGGSSTRSAQTLSGGNQQKLVLARELDGSPRLVVAENPTRGLDIRAAQAISERLRAVAESGAAVVLYSSDLDEVLALSTRILVLHAGQLRECALDRDAVGRAMLGVA
jgi:general nucleoside transport system ATP-binding protein